MFIAVYCIDLIKLINLICCNMSNKAVIKADNNMLKCVFHFW